MENMEKSWRTWRPHAEGLASLAGKARERLKPLEQEISWWNE